MDLRDINMIQNLVANMNVSGDSKEEETLGAEGGEKKETGPIHKFMSSISDTTTIYYQLTKLGTSLFLWIGGDDAKLTDLSLSSPTHYDKSGVPSTTRIFGPFGATESTSIAAKLATKLKKPIYVSFNLQGCDLQTLQQINLRIFEELSVYPEKF